MSKDEIITELVDLVLTQEKEIAKLKEKINRVMKYMEVYEEYLERNDI